MFVIVFVIVVCITMISINIMSINISIVSISGSGSIMDLYYLFCYGFCLTPTPIYTFSQYCIASHAAYRVSRFACHVGTQVGAALVQQNVMGGGVLAVGGMNLADGGAC